MIHVMKICLLSQVLQDLCLGDDGLQLISRETFWGPM